MASFNFVLYNNKTFPINLMNTLNKLYHRMKERQNSFTDDEHRDVHVTGADPGFLDRGFKLAERGSICAV